MPKALRPHLDDKGRLVMIGEEVTTSPERLAALQASGLVEASPPPPADAPAEPVRTRRKPRDEAPPAS